MKFTRHIDNKIEVKQLEAIRYWGTRGRLGTDRQAYIQTRRLTE